MNHPLYCHRADGTFVVPRVRLAKTHWRKLLGLMFDTSLAADEALYIEKCNAIHCCFMKIEIDVVFLDANLRILHLIPRMKPWRFSKVVRGGTSVLECYPGTIARYGLQVGEVLRIEPNSHASQG